MTPLLQTKTLTTQSEEVLARWRTLGLQSTYFMAQIIGFADLTLDLHQRMCTWIEGPATRKLGLVPRDHLKSSCWTIADTLRLITSDPLQRICIFNEVAANASGFLQRIKAIPERCELWQLLYPKRMPDFNGKWNNEQLVFPRPQDFVEPTLSAFGMGGASTSAHYTHIKEDDLIGKEASESDPVMQKAIDQHKLAEHLLVDPAHNHIDTYGTRWAPEDLYSWMLANEGNLSTFLTGCYGVDPDGEPRDWNDPLGVPIWPERFNRETLENIRLKEGNYLFALQKCNNPIAGGATEFEVDWLLDYDLIERNEKWFVVLHDPEGRRVYPLDDCAVWEAVDPGLSPDSKYARTAVMTVALTPYSPYDIVVLGAVAKKVSPFGCIELAHEEWLRWHPISCGIETVAGQKTFFYWIPREYPDMGIMPLPTHQHVKKDSHIRGVSPFAQQGRVYVNKKTQGDLLTEWSTFPTGRTKDLLDVFAHVMKIACPPDPSASDEAEWEQEFGTRSESGRNPVTGY